MGGSLPYSDWENMGSGQVPVKVNHPSVRNTCIYWIRQWASFHGWGGTVGGWGLQNNLEATHSLLPPEFRKSRTNEQDSKIVIWKTMPGDLPTMGQLLPIALLTIRSSPTKCMGLFPFEILFRCLPPSVKGLWGNLKETGDLTLRQQMQSLRLTLKNQWLGKRLPVSHSKWYIRKASFAFGAQPLDENPLSCCWPA
jgi:hypothetical protein